jgi:hypothetical protein
VQKTKKSERLDDGVEGRKRYYRQQRHKIHQVLKDTAKGNIEPEDLDDIVEELEE